MLSYFERYQGGEHERVWDELVQRGAEVFEEPLHLDAWAVAQETMRRVRHNIELLVPRLEQLGYRFGSLPDFPGYSQNTPIFTPPLTTASAIVDEWEALVGTIPLSLRAWFEIVGQVCLNGFHLDWPGTATLDPLWVDGLNLDYVRPQSLPKPTPWPCCPQLKPGLRAPTVEQPTRPARRCRSRGAGRGRNCWVHGLPVTRLSAQRRHQRRCPVRNRAPLPGRRCAVAQRVERDELCRLSENLLAVRRISRSGWRLEYHFSQARAQSKQGEVRAPL